VFVQVMPSLMGVVKTQTRTFWSWESCAASVMPSLMGVVKMRDKDFLAGI